MFEPMRLLPEERGATAIEYGLIVALIALAAIPGLMSLQARQGQSYGKAESALSHASRNGGQSFSP